MSGGSGSTTTRVELPPFQQREMEFGFGAARNLFQNPPTLFQGSRLAPMSDTTVGSFDLGRQTADQLNQFGGDIRSAFNSSTNMDIAGNPVFQGAADAITSRLNRQFSETLPQITESFASGGAFGGSDQQLAAGRAQAGLHDATAESLAGLATNFFQTQASRSNAALASLPGLIAGQRAGFDLTSEVGAREDTRMQMELDDAIAEFEQGQLAPELALDRFLGRITGDVGQTQAQRGPPPNRLAGAAGGALAGYQVGGPYGALAGGVLGLLVA